MTLEINNQKVTENINYFQTQAVGKHKEGQAEEAITFYLEAIALDNNQPAWVYGNTITLLAEIGSLDQGLKLGEKAEKFHPESDEVYRAIGLVYEKQKDIF